MKKRNVRGKIASAELLKIREKMNKLYQNNTMKSFEDILKE